MERTYWLKRLAVGLLLAALLRFFYVNMPFFYRDIPLSAAALQFQERTIVIKSGHFYQLHLNWPEISVKYSSEHPLVAAVGANGRILGLKPGKTVVSAADGSKTASSRVYVITLPKRLNLDAGGRKRIKVKGKTGGISYYSQDESVAKVSRFGYVRGVSAGNTKIIVKIYGFEFAVDVTVRKE